MAQSSPEHRRREASDCSTYESPLNQRAGLSRLAQRLPASCLQARGHWFEPSRAHQQERQSRRSAKEPWPARRDHPADPADPSGDHGVLLQRSQDRQWRRDDEFVSRVKGNLRGPAGDGGRRAPKAAGRPGTVSLQPSSRACTARSATRLPSGLPHSRTRAAERAGSRRNVRRFARSQSERGLRPVRVRRRFR